MLHHGSVDVLHHGFVDVVEIGSASEHLRLAPSTGDPHRDHLVAHLVSDGLAATRTVYAHDGSAWRELAEFFAGLAQDWRGWTETRGWASLEGDLMIRARHEHGRVLLHVTLSQDRGGRGGRGWPVAAGLALEPGEQLSRVAAELARLARVEP